MEKLPMCRICLVENVRMYVVVNRNLHKLYEKLTDIPFVTEDSRPILACFFCCAKLKQCYRLLRQCVAAEELFTQMINEDYEGNLLNQYHFEFYSRLIKSPTENMSIVDVIQIDDIASKEELPTVCEGLDDIIELNDEHQSDEPELENINSSCLDVADIQPHHSESESEDDLPLMEFKMEVEEQRRREANRATVAKKPKLDARRTNLEDAITAERTRKDESDSKVSPGTYFKEPYESDQHSFNPVKKMIQHRTQIGKKPFKCGICQRSFNVNSALINHIRRHYGEKPFKCDVCQRSFNNKYPLSRHMLIHTGEKPFMCDVCQRSFTRKSALRNHIRIHTGETPFKCDKCQCSFRTNGDLASHIRTHTSETTFKCEICECRFITRGYLRIHSRTHTGEKPFKCDICQRSFLMRRNLTIHIKTHAGPSGPENLSECGKNQKMVGWKVEGQKVLPVFCTFNKKKVLDQRKDLNLR